MKFLNRLVVVCLVMALVAAAFPSLVNTAWPADVAKAQTGGTTTLYLPTLSHNVFTERPPFSLQIAGLSQIAASSALADLPAEEAAAAQEAIIAELDAAFPSMLEAIKESGAGYVRVYIDWAGIQPDEGGAYKWNFYDLRLPQLDQAGLGLIATVTNAPLWARTNDNVCGLIEDPAVYYRFLEELHARYPYIDVWEILNEPDARDGYRCSDGVMNYGEHGGAYKELLQGAYELLKGLDPAARVIMGGMAYDHFTDEQNGNYFVRTFLDEMVQAGGAPYTDGVNFHFFKNFAAGWEGWTGVGKPTCLGVINQMEPGDKIYSPYGRDITAKASHVNERMKTCFGVEKPLWLTEVGANGVPEGTADYPKVLDPDSHFFGANETDQARYVFTVHARGFAMGAENITWYAIKIQPDILDQDYQGLLYDSRTPNLENEPKPAYYAYQTLTRELGYYRFDQWIAFNPRTNPQAEAYQFKHVAGPAAGNTKIVAWRNTGDPAALTLGVTELRVVYRPGAGLPEDFAVTDGGAMDADGAVNGSITFNLLPEPVIIEIVR